LFKSGAVKDWDAVIKKKGKKADDSSILIRSMAKKYEKEGKKEFKDIIKDKVKFKDLDSVTNLFTNGNLPHGYSFSKDELNKIGFNIKSMPQKDMEIIMKAIINAKEGLS
ncbi:unnamed protein product, partial [marine sediment metagenome]